MNKVSWYYNQRSNHRIRKNRSLLRLWISPFLIKECISQFCLTCLIVFHIRLDRFRCVCLNLWLFRCLILMLSQGAGHLASLRPFVYYPQLPNQGVCFSFMTPLMTIFGGLIHKLRQGGGHLASPLSSVYYPQRTGQSRKQGVCFKFMIP